MVPLWGVGFILSVFSQLDDGFTNLDGQSKPDIYAPAIANGDRQDQLF